MSKIFAPLFLLFLFSVTFLAPKTYAQALNDCPYSPAARTAPDPVFSDSAKTPKATFFVNVRNNKDYDKWKMQFECGLLTSVSDAKKELNGTEISREMNNSNNACEFSAGNHTIKVIAVTTSGQEVPQCRTIYTVVDSDIQCELQLSGNGKILTPEDKIITSQTDLTVSGKNLTAGGHFGLFIDDQHLLSDQKITTGGLEVDTPTFTMLIPKTSLTPTSHLISLKKRNGGIVETYSSPLCSITFTVGTPSNPGSVISNPTKGSPAPIQPVRSGGSDCNDGRGPAIQTAIGCIHTNPAELVKDLMKFVIGISGGLAFLMMLLGAFQMLTSAGNPETLAAGKGRITNAVIGLLIIIFAILLLQIIGFDILKIPGFDRK